MNYDTARFMRSWEDRQLTILKGHYPGWDIWLGREPGKTTNWCARKRDGSLRYVTDSPESLIRFIVRPYRP